VNRRPVKPAGKKKNEPEDKKKRGSQGWGRTPETSSVKMGEKTVFSHKYKEGRGKRERQQGVGTMGVY